MTNSIIANNRKEDCGLAAPGTYGEIEGGRIGANSNNWVGDGSCEAAYSGDPILGRLTDNGGGTLTHLPLPGSPAIDMLPAAACSLVIDQRGLPRPVAVTSADTLCDLGATEVQGNE